MTSDFVVVFSGTHDNNRKSNITMPINQSFNCINGDKRTEDKLLHTYFMYMGRG